MATNFVRVNGPASLVNTTLQWLYQWNTIPTDLYYSSLNSYVVSHTTISLPFDMGLVERIALRGICRTVGVTLKWLLGFLVQCVEALPDHLNLQPVTYKQNVMMQCLEVEADEMSSFVQKKANKQWIWSAMDAKTRQVTAFHIGNRSRKNANQLWAKIPLEYRQHATFYTDQYVVNEGVIPAARHRAINKLARKTNHIERFNTRAAAYSEHYMDITTTSCASSCSRGAPQSSAS